MAWPSASTPAARATCSPSTRARVHRRGRPSRAPPARPAADARAGVDGDRGRRRRRRDGDGVAQPAGRQRLQGVPRRRGADRRRRTTPTSRRGSPPSTRRPCRWRRPTTRRSSGSDDAVVDGYIDSMRADPAAPGGHGAPDRLHPDARCRWRARAAGVRRRRAAVAVRRRPSSSSPTRRSRPWRSRTPRNRGRWTCVIALGHRAGRPARPRQRPRRRPPRGGDPADRTVRGAASAATRSAGCSPTTC